MAMQRMLLALGAVLITGSAWAQPAPWQPERTTAGWTFTPGVVLGTAWDSNVTVQTKGNPVRSEWVALVNPRGEVDYNGARTRFNLGYSGSLEAYRRFDELNRYEQRGRIELRHRASERLAAYARGGVMLSPTTDRLELAGAAVPFVDIGSKLITATSGITLDAGPRTHLEISYRFQDVRFDETDEDAFRFLQGGYSHAPMATVMFDVTRRLSLGAGWQYERARIDEGRQTFDLQTGAAELAYRIAEFTTVRVGGGISYLQATNGNLSTTGPAVHGGIQHNRGRATFNARFERSFTPSYTFGGITTNQSVSASARVAFAANRAYVLGGVTHGRTDPVEEIGLGFRTDSIWFNGALGVSLTRWLRAEAFYSGSHQTSTARGNIDRTRVGVQFVTFKPVRID
jgi:hypothetical protein